MDAIQSAPLNMEMGFLPAFSCQLKGISKQHGGAFLFFINSDKNALKASLSHVIEFLETL